MQLALALAQAVGQRQLDPLLDGAGASGSTSGLRGAAARDALTRARQTNPGRFSQRVMANMLREVGPSPATAPLPTERHTPDPLIYLRGTTATWA